MEGLRRRDREVTDMKTIGAWLKEARVVRLGFAVAGEPYIVPLSFGLGSLEPLELYFHGAPAGRKLEMMKANPRVCFELDFCDQPVDGGGVACQWSQNYRSLVGWGTLERLQDPDEARRGLECLMAQFSTRTGWEWDEKLLKSVAVLRLRVESFSAKQRV